MKTIKLYNLKFYLFPKVYETLLSFLEIFYHREYIIIVNI